VRVRYYKGSGTFGHSCYEHAAQAAAIMSQQVGRPVRVQFMRWDEHGWDNYGPAHLAGAADGKPDSRIAAAQISPVVGYHLSVWKAVNGDDSPI
jgi:nicotinate dehydrogenase subunit B